MAEVLSRSQRTRLRKASRLSAAGGPPPPCLPPYKLGTVVAGGRRLSPVLGATKTLERLHPSSWLLEPSLGEEGRLAELVTRVLAIDVGSHLEEAGQVLRESREFRARGLALLRRLRQLCLPAMLEHHCPKTSLHQPASSQQVLGLLRAVLHKAGIHHLVSLPEPAVTAALTRLLELTKGGHLTLSSLLHVLPPPRLLVPWLTGCHKAVKTHLGARLAVWALVALPRTVLSALFTITDSSHGKRSLLYYRQSVWQAMTASALHTLQQRGLTETRADAFLQPRDPSKPRRPPPPAVRPMRFIPKANLARVRPISMRKARVADHDPALDKNSGMRLLVRAMVKLRPATADLKGKRLCREWSRLYRAAPPGTPLFWATADISDAFGSVLHKKLTRILTDTAKLLVCYPNARKLANEVCYRLVRHLVSFRVGGRTRVFHQGRGLVQGDPFSPDLSSLYYGDMTATCLSPFLIPPHSHHEIFLRAADDFLFVSTSRERVWAFQRATIGSSFPEYGAQFAKHKFETNVETGDQTSPAKFCGALLHMSSRAVVPHLEPDLQPLAAMKPRNQGDKARPTIAKKFLMLCGVHMTPLYLGHPNTRATVLATLALNLATALGRLLALLNSYIWAQGRRVEEGWLWRQVLMPAQAKVAGLMRRTGVPLQEVRLVSLLCLSSALAGCPRVSRQLRKGVENSLGRARRRAGEDRARQLARLVGEAKKPGTTH